MLCLLRISVDLNFGVTSIGTQCMSIVDELENYTVVVAQPTPSHPRPVYESSFWNQRKYMKHLIIARTHTHVERNGTCIDSSRRYVQSCATGRG